MTRTFYCKKKDQIFDGAAEALIHCNIGCKEECELNGKNNRGSEKDSRNKTI